MSHPPRTTRAVIAAAATVGLLATSAPATAAQDADTVVSGQLADSTEYRFVVPADWNGTVFVSLDFADDTPSAAQRELIDRGYAYGGTTRNVTGWNLAGAVGNQIEALDALSAAVRAPDRAITMGTSMGGMIAAATGELHPDRIDGVLAACGGLSGTVSQWNQKLDTVFVLSRLLDPAGDLPVADVPAYIEGSRTAWLDRLAEAQQSPAGRARIALAAAIGQLPAWSWDIADPDPQDVEAYQASWYGALAGDPLPYIGQAMSSRHAITDAYGGLPSWNTGIDYAEQLRKASPESRRVVAELYAAAGLSLDQDLATVNAGKRVEAESGAAERFAEAYEFTGDISVPTVTLNNVGDQISTVAQQQEYGERITQAGHASLLRQTYVASAGHCNFTAGETLAATQLLLDRLDSGHWDSANHVQMNRAATALDLGDARFLNYHPDRFNR